MAVESSPSHLRCLFKITWLLFGLRVERAERALKRRHQQAAAIHSIFEYVRFPNGIFTCFRWNNNKQRADSSLVAIQHCSAVSNVIVVQQGDVLRMLGRQTHSQTHNRSKDERRKKNPISLRCRV